jgi:hypothetical protein
MVIPANVMEVVEISQHLHSNDIAHFDPGITIGLNGAC